MIIPVILSGGSGTRLWPLSRKKTPKQFSHSVSQPCLFQKACNLTSNFGKPIIVTNKEYTFLIEDAINKNYDTMLIEPTGKNTAPAIIASTLYVREKYGPKANVLVLSSDHLIQEKDEFERSISNGLYGVNNGIVVFGIKPTRSETGYGYIETDGVLQEKCSKVKQFKEKPNLETAEQFTKSGHFFWNAGIFLFNAEYFCEVAAKIAPEMFRIVEKSFKNSIIDGQQTFLSDDFLQIKSNSIDYEILEKHDSVFMTEMLSSWSDIGSFSSLYEISPKDENLNFKHGKIIATETKNSFLRNDDSKNVMVVHGLDNIIAVQTSDATLIMPMEQSQCVKKIVELVPQKLAIEHPTVQRPWGSYTIVQEGEGFKVKRITVESHKCLSLQSHKHRSENWTVIKGRATVINNGKTTILNAGESIFISKESKHRLCNRETEIIEIIEIQTGEYLEEDDIIRYEDDWNRIENNINI
jgi:mannose-1-phosphate guanylyltransferase/mannose-6-phosphate isomerase